MDNDRKLNYLELCDEVAKLCAERGESGISAIFAAVGEGTDGVAAMGGGAADFNNPVWGEMIIVLAGRIFNNTREADSVKTYARNRETGEVISYADKDNETLQ